MVFMREDTARFLQVSRSLAGIKENCGVSMSVGI
jgi:hypothetical protein